MAWGRLLLSGRPSLSISPRRCNLVRHAWKSIHHPRPRTSHSSASQAMSAAVNLCVYYPIIGWGKPRPVEATEPPPKRLRILSWNVDFMAPDVAGRLDALLQHCGELAAADPIDIILLQEVYYTTGVDVLSKNHWLRANYAATSLQPRPNGSAYATYTFVKKNLLPYFRSAFILQYNQTQMGRDALVVDFDLGLPGGNFQVINVHFESMPYGEDARRIQMGQIQTLLSSAGAGLVAGDMNCICPGDQNLPEEHGLRDLWDDKNGPGFTWGFQPPSRRPMRRMDKVLTTGNIAGEVSVVGDNVRAPLVYFSDDEAEEGVEGDWVSEHLGGLATVRLP